MKALSLSRPWTTLVLQHGKDVENRTWGTKHRGPLLIHGALSWDGHALNEALRCGIWIDNDQTQHPTGILGMVDVIGSCTAAKAYVPCDCGPWSMYSQAHWSLANPRSLPEPIPCPGQLGLWTPPWDVIDEVQRWLDAAR